LETDLLIGYARVSTEDQNLNLQLDALKGAGCYQVCTDQISGTAKHRPGLEDAFKYLRPGDTLVVWKLDRLGRTMKGLVDLVEDLKAKNIQFKSLTDGIDTSTASGRFFFHVMAAMAQMERELIKERTKAGLAAAKLRGRTGGRKKVMDASKLEAAKVLLDAGTPVTEVAKHLGIGRATLYRALHSATSILDLVVTMPNVNLDSDFARQGDQHGELGGVSS
jgi:DNA invertase Pin-like site-specific DNA recombinase